MAKQSYTRHISESDVLAEGLQDHSVPRYLPTIVDFPPDVTMSSWLKEPGRLDTPCPHCECCIVYGVSIHTCQTSGRAPPLKSRQGHDGRKGQAETPEFLTSRQVDSEVFHRTEPPPGEGWQADNGQIRPFIKVFPAITLAFIIFEKTITIPPGPVLVRLSPGGTEISTPDLCVDIVHGDVFIICARITARFRRYKVRDGTGQCEPYTVLTWAGHGEVSPGQVFKVSRVLPTDQPATVQTAGPLRAGLRHHHLWIQHQHQGLRHRHQRMEHRTKDYVITTYGFSISTKDYVITTYGNSISTKDYVITTYGNSISTKDYVITTYGYSISTKDYVITTYGNSISTKDYVIGTKEYSTITTSTALPPLLVPRNRPEE
ncbi:hypothetical protein Bbelb_424070 [Branchiostoma belcheri]|nr:hypothetical protein Bbelb_424070 [Branchiostoma belcheri]